MRRDIIQQLTMRARIAVIMTDAAGYPRRADTLRRTLHALGIPFLRVAPADRPQPGALPVDLPVEWLPADDRPLHQKHWYRNHLHCLAAVRSYGLHADHYWCAEADVSASPGTWLRLIGHDRRHAARRVVDAALPPQRAPRYRLVFPSRHPAVGRLVLPGRLVPRLGPRARLVGGVRRRNTGHLHRDRRAGRDRQSRRHDQPGSTAPITRRSTTAGR